MNRGRIIGEALCCALMGLWLGMIGMSAYFAAMLFPTMKALSPQLAGFENYEGDHWRIAAGQVAAKVFAVLSYTPMAIVLLYLFVYGGMCFGADNARDARKRFLMVLVIFLAGLALKGSVLGRMQRLIEAHWDAARDGQKELAASLLQDFSAMHPWATTALTLEAAIAVFMIGVSVRTLAQMRGRGR